MKLNKVLFVRLHVKTKFEVFSPPIGILYIISYLRKKRPDIKIELYDMVLNGVQEKDLISYIKKSSPDVVLFSLTYLERDLFYEILKKLKEEFREILTVAGGPGISSAPVDFLKRSEVDFVVQAEGEKRTVHLLDAIERKIEPDMDGIGFKRNGDVFFQEAITFIENLDELEIPAWDMTDLKKFSSLPNLNSMLRGKKYAQIITSRGCPFSCPYCQNYYLNGSVRHRKRSVGSVIKELKFLRSLQVDEVHIMDDTFNLPKERAVELLHAIIKEDLGLYMTFQGIRMDSLDEEIIRLMKKAGTYKIEFGVQHVDPDIVKKAGRTSKESLKKIKKNIRIAAKYNILTYAYFIYGFPGEKMDQSMKNIKAAIYLSADMVAFLKLIPLPKTEYFDMLESPENIPSVEFNFYNECPELTLSDYDEKELKRIQVYSYRAYYLNRFRFFRTVFRLPWTSYWIKIIFFKYIRDILNLFFKRNV